MPETTAQKHHRRRGKPLTLALVLLTLAAILAAPLYYTFGPNPPIVVSKATTHITAPLAEDGLPDYAAALLAEVRGNVTPETNGAALFITAMWPGVDEEAYNKLDSADASLLCKELGLANPPVGPHLEPFNSPQAREALLAWLRERAESGVSTHLTDADLLRLDNSAAFKSQRFLTVQWDSYPLERPWSEADAPPFAAWVDRNAEAIDLMVAGIGSDDWYLPNLGWLRSDATDVGSYEMQLVRDAARVLNQRCLLRLGRGETARAAEDAAASLRLAEKAARRPLLIDQLVAAAIGGMAFSNFNQVSESAGPGDGPILREALAELDTLPGLLRMGRALNRGERFWALAMAIDASRGGGMLRDEMVPFSPYGWLSTDWNPVLRHHNETIDQAVAVFRRPTWSGRMAAATQLDARLQAATESESTSGISWRRMLTPTGRGEASAKLWLAMGWGGQYESILRAIDRVAAQRVLTRVGLALAIYRVEQGGYPETLGALVPDVLDAVPVDSFDGQALVYRKTEDGFLLYSLGPNGVDDGGSRTDEGGGARFEGRDLDMEYDYESEEWTPADQELADLAEQIADGADDPSLRLPLPRPAWPWERPN